MQYTNLINNLIKINNQLTQYNNSSKSNITSQKYIKIIQLLNQLNHNIQPYKLFFK